MRSSNFDFFCSPLEFGPLLETVLRTSDFLMIQFFGGAKLCAKHEISRLMTETSPFSISIWDQPFDSSNLDFYPSRSVELGIIRILVPMVRGEKLLCASMGVGTAFLNDDGIFEPRPDPTRRFQEIKKNICQLYQVGLWSFRTGKRRQIAFSKEAKHWFESGGSLCDIGWEDECYSLLPGSAGPTP